MSDDFKQEQVEQPQTNQSGQTIIINQQQTDTNGCGVAGFVLSLIAIVLCWVPILNIILWLLGLILSLIGVFKQPRDLAIAGLVVSLIVIIVTIIIVFFAAAIIGAASLA